MLHPRRGGGRFWYIAQSHTRTISHSHCARVNNNTLLQEHYNFNLTRTQNKKYDTIIVTDFKETSVQRVTDRESSQDGDLTQDVHLCWWTNHDAELGNDSSIYTRFISIHPHRSGIVDHIQDARNRLQLNICVKQGINKITKVKPVCFFVMEHALRYYFTYYCY